MSQEPNKRAIPAGLKKLLDYDIRLTKTFCAYTDKFLPFTALKMQYKLLEISCHGIPWFTGWLAFVWLIDNPNLYQMQVNFYLGLILDVILVAVAKAFVRRRRPSANAPDMFATYGPDLYSFPSGHASRAALIVFFFTTLYPLPIFCYPPLLAWSTSICISRILLQRHYLLDVFAGVVLGIFEGLLMSLIWINSETCHQILSGLLNEKQAGGSRII